VLADHPVGYWRLGEKAGAVASDKSGNENSGIYTSNVSFGQTGALTASGDSDTAAEFDGSTTYVSIGEHASYVSNRVSVEAWFYPKSLATYSAIVNRRTAANAGGTALELDTSGVLRFYVRVGGTWYNAFKAGLTTNTWYHAVGTYDGTKLSLTLNGDTPSTSAAAGTQDTPASPTVMIGKAVNNTTYFNGIIDEVALYNYPLSATQIANHYNSGNGPGWWICQSQTQMDSSNWNLLSSHYNSTTAQLFVNGQLECSVTPGTTYSSSATTRMGSNTAANDQFWQGLLASVKLFGTSDGSTVTTSSTIRSNFNAEANRFRAMPLENTVTSGAVLNLDPANAKLGVTPYATGCASTDLSWFDLSSSGIGSTLLNFVSGDCSGATADGWRGSGTPTDPYRLVFDGVNDYIKTSYVQTAVTAYTVEAWIKTTQTGGGYHVILTDRGTGAGNSLTFYQHNASPYGICLAHDSAFQIRGRCSAAGIHDGIWHHVVGTWSAPSGTAVVQSQFNIYVDGTLTNVDTGGGATPNSPLTGLGGALIGHSLIAAPWNTYFQGSLGKLTIYERELTVQEIKQNCLAQVSRYSGASCAP
jgi:hypothetical protein